MRRSPESLMRAETSLPASPSRPRFSGGGTTGYPRVKNSRTAWGGRRSRSSPKSKSGGPSPRDRKACSPLSVVVQIVTSTASTPLSLRMLPKTPALERGYGGIARGSSRPEMKYLSTTVTPRVSKGPRPPMSPETETTSSSLSCNGRPRGSSRFSSKIVASAEND